MDWGGVDSNPALPTKSSLQEVMFGKRGLQQRDWFTAVQVVLFSIPSSSLSFSFSPLSLFSLSVSPSLPSPIPFSLRLSLFSPARSRCHDALTHMEHAHIWKQIYASSSSSSSALSARGDELGKKKLGDGYKVPVICHLPRSHSVHTGLGSSSLVAHVLQYPPPPHANSFVLGPAVINTHTFCLVC